MSAAQPPLALPDKPSLAVLPFTNMSGDPEQEFVSDGIAEDVISALSHYPSLFVIARNSTTRPAIATPELRDDLLRVGRQIMRKLKQGITSGPTATTAIWPIFSRCRMRLHMH